MVDPDCPEVGLVVIDRLPAHVSQGRNLSPRGMHGGHPGVIFDVVDAAEREDLAAMKGGHDIDAGGELAGERPGQGSLM